MENSTCCFTGHRPQSLPFRLNEKDKRCVALREKLKAKIGNKMNEGMLMPYRKVLDRQ